MKILDKFVILLRKLFPSTFTIAILLTFLTFGMALYINRHNPDTGLWAVTVFWYKGLWDLPMLGFAVQMMLILVLGYSIASTPAVRGLIDSFLRLCTTTAKAAYWITLFTILLSLLNWGLGLIFGAVFARKVAEKFAGRKQKLNYPLIAAAGYTGLMTWHGGISGSAPLKVAEAGHLMALTGNDLPAIPFTQTVFSPMNLVICLVLIIVLPVLLSLVGRKLPEEVPLFQEVKDTTEEEKTFSGLEKLDHAPWFGTLLGMALLVTAMLLAVKNKGGHVVSPNYINFWLLGLALLLHRKIHSFLVSIRQAMPAAGGILVQFPLYFGIMGIMRNSGMVESFSGFLVHISNSTTFPLFTFASAAIVNLFVPSGGGQWAVQGHIIIEAASTLNIPLGKAVMALAYGDQLTNMLQPFWALPLLGITGLKARDIIPFTLILMLAGIVIFCLGLLLF